MNISPGSPSIAQTPLLWHLKKCLWSKSTLFCLLSRTITLWGYGKKWVFLTFIGIVTSIRPGAKLKLNKWLLNTILYVLSHLPSSAWFTFWQKAWKCPWQTWNPRPGEKEETSADSFWVYLLTFPEPDLQKALLEAVEHPGLLRLHLAPLWKNSNPTQRGQSWLS